MEINEKRKNINNISENESNKVKKTSEKDFVEINKNAKHPFHYIIDGNKILQIIE